MNEYRTHNCGELNEKNIGSEVKLSGWVQKIRNLGGMVFIDLRDQFGITQIVISSEEMQNKVKEINDKLFIAEEEMTLQKEENAKLIESLQQKNIDLKEEIDYNNAKITSLKQADDLAMKEYSMLEKELHHKIEKFVNAKVF